MGDPVGSEAAIEGIVRDITRYCEDNGWDIAFYQAMPDFLEVYQSLGFKKLEVGDDAIGNLTQFTLEGKAAKTIWYQV